MFAFTMIHAVSAGAEAEAQDTIPYVESASRTLRCSRIVQISRIRPGCVSHEGFNPDPMEDTG